MVLKKPIRTGLLGLNHIKEYYDHSYGKEGVAGSSPVGSSSIKRANSEVSYI